MYAAMLLACVISNSDGVLPSDASWAAREIQSPVNSPVSPIPPEKFDAISKAVHLVAIEWQIMDERESRYICSKQEQFQEDVNFLRKRLNDLKDTPMIEDACRIPEKKLLDDAIAFNRQYKSHLDLRVIWEADRAHVLNEAIQETEYLYRLYDAMRESKCDFHYVSYRRLSLAKARKYMGEVAWEKGEIPDCVPIWRFYTLR